jgi:hypothetical protein
MPSEPKIYSSANPLTATEITKYFVFGTTDPSSPDYSPHIRPETSDIKTIKYDMNDYMTEGAGRYAYPSIFGAVEKFFNSPWIWPGTYSYTTNNTPDTFWSGWRKTRQESGLSLRV